MHTEVVWNQALCLSYPEGFRLLEEAERQKLSVLVDGPGACLRDEDRHIMLSVGWKPVNPLLSLLVSAKDAAVNAEKMIRRPMEAYGYKPEGPVSGDMGGERAEGFRYSYEASGIPMCGETRVVKHRNVLYYFNYYTREALREENLAVWQEILDSVRWM